MSETLNRIVGLAPLERHLDGESPHKRSYEVGVLCDIRETAERVGEEVPGFPLERFVEGEQAKSTERRCHRSAS